MKKVWVEMEVPNTSQFCFWEDGTFSHMKFMVELKANVPRGFSASDKFPIFMAVKDAIQYMGSRVDQLVVCCSSAARQSCECGWSFDGIRDFTSLNGFYEFEAQVSPSISANTSCVCLDNYSINYQAASSDSFEVVSLVSVDSLYLNEDLKISITDLFLILKEMGEIFQTVYNTKFFAVVTDQYVFCEEDPSNPAFRGSQFEYTISEINKKMWDTDNAVWMNINHHEGNATVSINAKGGSWWDWELISKLYNCFYHKDGFLACAFNEVAFAGNAIIKRADDLVLEGRNNSSIKVINDVLKVAIVTDIDYLGNHVLADLSNQVFGVQTQAGLSGSVFVKVGGAAYTSHALFLSGDYAGYWYPYAGFYGAAGAQYTAGVAADFGKSVFYGSTELEESNRPYEFAGHYVGTNGSMGGILGIGLGIHGGYSKSFVMYPSEEDPDPEWGVIHGGFHFSVGPKAGFTGGINGEVGHLVLLYPQLPTSERSWANIVANWITTLLVIL